MAIKDIHANTIYPRISGIDAGWKHAYDIPNQRTTVLDVIGSYRRWESSRLSFLLVCKPARALRTELCCLTSCCQL
eukprot:scaffold287214_cov22-Prasinocladus_malaysianus.AAC.1